MNTRERKQLLEDVIKVATSAIMQINTEGDDYRVTSAFGWIHGQTRHAAQPDTEKPAP